MGLKTIAAASMAAMLLAEATAAILPRNDYAGQPPCSYPFTSFDYVGCYVDPQYPKRALDWSPEGLSQNMTVELCVAYCKSNNFRYSGLEYYGQCYCGDSVNGPQAADPSECSYACTGDPTEVCGGNLRLSVYQDPTFAPVDTTTISDYMPLGCWTDQLSLGRAVYFPQDLDGSAMTTELCLSTCKAEGYPFAATEYSSECYCGVVLGNGTSQVDDSFCQMPCNGNQSESCGGSQHLNLYVANDLKEKQPCGPTVQPPPSTTMASTAYPTTTSTDVSSTSSFDATTTTPTDTPTSTPSMSTSSYTPTSTSTSSASSSSVETTSSSSTSLYIDSTTSSTSTYFSSSTSSSSSTLSTSPTSSTSSTLSTSSASPTSSSVYSSSTSSTASTTSTLSTSSTSSSVYSSSSSSTSSSTTSSTSSSSSYTTPTKTSTSSISTSTPSTTSTISSESSTSYTTPTSTSSSTKITTTTSTTTTLSTLKTSTTTTKTTSYCTAPVPTPTCEYACGSWCSKPLPPFTDKPSCLQASAMCFLQTLDCYLTAGYPANQKCAGFLSWCENVGSYCSSKCPYGNCNKSDCTKTYPASTTSTAQASTCTPPPVTTTTMTTSTKAATTTSVCPPTASNICVLPNGSPSSGYSGGKCVGNIQPPYVTCNDLAADWKQNPFKLYKSKDSSACPSYPRSSVPNACQDACNAQYTACVNTYAASCKAGGQADSYSGALTKCANQKQDCLKANQYTSGGSRCSSYGSGWS